MTKVRRYAEGTSVEVTKSKADIEKLVTDNGATGFMSAWETTKKPHRSVVIFRLNERMLRYEVPLPDPQVYHHSEGGRARSKEQMRSKADEEHRRRWRALFLIIKAKLEIVASSEEEDSFDRVFLSDILLPDGTTAGDVLVPQLAQSYRDGKMPKLLSM